MSRRCRKALAPGPMVNGRRLTPAQVSVLRAAGKAELGGDAATARRLRLRLAADIEAAADAQWLAGALAEMATLEARRGQTLEVGRGRVRISGRDGLETLRATGAIGAAQLAAGMRYRGCFENAQPRIASVLATHAGGGRGRPGRPEAVAIRMAQARRDLDRMEQAVADRYAALGAPGLVGDALLALREIAGLGRSLRELTTSGHRRGLLRTRLAEALEAIGG